MMMSSDNTLARLPAEWEPQGAVLLAWPHKDTDWAYMLDEAQRCYVDMIEAFTKSAVVILIAPDTSEPRERLKHIDPARLIFFDVPTNDTWIRDYGAITTKDENIGCFTINDFGFNAWGGKFESVLDNAVTARMVEAGLLVGHYVDNRNFILEGGSIESEGHGTIMTTSSCLLTTTRNKEYSKEDIESRLRSTLGAKKVLWLDKGEILGDDTDGHIDTIARFAPDNTILYCGSTWGDPSDPQTKALNGVGDRLATFTDAQGEPFNLIELPMPYPIYDPEDGHRLPATYANFLILNDSVFMPSYGQPQNDRHAKMTLQIAFPNHNIVEVDCRALIRQHGSLHCATMQVPYDIVPFL